MPLSVKTGLWLAVLCLAPLARAEEPTAPAVPAADPKTDPSTQPVPATPPAPTLEVKEEPMRPSFIHPADGVVARSTNPSEQDLLRVSVPPFLGVDLRFAGYFWADTGYLDRTNAQPGQYDQGVTYLQGRFVLGVGLSRSWGAYYADAKVEYLGLVNEYAHSQYEPHTLDAYVRVGHQQWWDVQIGRFLAWEVYHRGQGIELFTAEEAGALGGPSLYWLDLTRGYRNETGQAAIHFYPLSWLKFEVSSVYGQQNNQNNLGVRPALHLTLKDFQFLAGFEYLSQTPQTIADKTSTTSTGYAARAQYTFFKTVTVGGEFAQVFIDSIDIQGLQDTDKSLSKYTFGGYVDIDFWRNSIGLGYHRTNQVNQQNETNHHDQAFVTYTFKFPIPGLSAKAVYGFARAHIQDTDTKSSWDNYLHSFRLRISYEFN